MDYGEFFKELKACHMEHGIPFGYEFSGPVKNANICPGFVNSIKNKSCYSRKACSKKFSYKSNRKLATTLNKNLLWNLKSSMAFSSFPSDLVYGIAWRLSERIGRLPDNLHNRMVLSIDGHPAIARYIEKHG